MAMKELPSLKPRMPRVEDLDPERLAFSYDDETDTLFVHFYGEPLPAVSVEVQDDAFVRVDPVTEEVVGLQIEAFLTRAVLEHPSLLKTAEIAGVPSPLIEDARRRISPAELKREGLSALVGQLHLVPA